MYDSTSTFKTRRKHHLLLLICLATLVHNVASMAVPINCPEPCECYLNNNGLQSARCSEIYTNQSEFPNIHVLVLRISESEDQCNIPKDLNVIFPQLNYLYMMNCSLTNIPERAFENLTSLQEIDLSNNFIETIDSSIFINNAKLTYANLQNNALQMLDNKPFLISKSMQELDLSSCGIKKLPQKMFKSLSKLKYLTLTNNELSTIAQDTLPESIRVLNLNRNSITHVPIKELERLPKLREIDLSENPINCTCSTLSFQDHLSGKPVIFLNNGMECMYPAEYRGRQSAHVPFMSICMAELAALKPEEDEDIGGIKTNEILPEETLDKKKSKQGKKDNIQDDFERDEVVPYDKKSYTDEMQSDSVADEGSGSGGFDEEDSTSVPDVKETKPSTTSDNNENNETKEGNSSSTLVDSSSESAKKVDVTSYTAELNNTNSETSTNPATSPETEKQTDKTEPSPETPPSSTEASKPTPEIIIPTTEPTKTEPETNATSSESPKTEASQEPSSESPTSTSEAPVSPLESVKPESDTTPLSSEPNTPSSSPSSSASDVPTTPKSEPTVSTTESLAAKMSSDNSTQVESGVSHALQKDDSNTINLGYIIPCLAILIIIIICLGIYLGQRSSHKNWEPAPSNDGAELQDVSLLPENGKMPIVKNKYPAEGNSEQTERLMNDSNSGPKSVWEHLEEPLGNGNSVHPKDSDKLPNGQSTDKNEPIECAIAKVTTLPDSVPRTPLIRNT